MRFSLKISLAFFAVFFTFAAASPVLVSREPTKAVAARRPVHLKGASQSRGPIPKGRAARRTPQKALARFHGKDAASKAVHKQSGAACARRASAKQPRDLEFEYFARRDDFGDNPLPSEYTIGEKIDGGGFGDIHKVLGRPDLLAKKSAVKYGFKQTSEEFREEAKHLKAVGQFVAWGYKEGAEDCHRDFYIIMRKIEGTPFDRTSTWIHTRDAGDVAQCTAFLDKVVGLVAKKVVQYSHSARTFHGDVNPSNVMCVEKDGQIVSVDLIDWGSAYPVKPEAVIKENDVQVVEQVKDLFETRYKSCGIKRKPSNTG